MAKKKLKDYSFYGNKLKIEYAPDFETKEQTKAKMLLRIAEVN